MRQRHTAHGGRETRVAPPSHACFRTTQPDPPVRWRGGKWEDASKAGVLWLLRQGHPDERARELRWCGWRPHRPCRSAGEASSALR
eukprot:758378-Prymnesium_polylepis.1